MREFRNTSISLTLERRKQLLFAARLLVVYNLVANSPRIVKYALIHAGATFGTLSLMPPAGQLPGAVVLVVWAASFCVAYSLMAVFRL